MISVRLKEGRNKEDKISPVWFASEMKTKEIRMPSHLTIGKYFILILVITEWTKGELLTHVKTVKEPFNLFELRMRSRFLIALDGIYNPDSAQIIKATRIQSPFDNQTFNFTASYIHQIMIPWADSSSRLLLGVECVNQNPPFDIHESVREFFEKHLKAVNRELSKDNYEIPDRFKRASFYEKQLRFLKCMRQRKTIEWEIAIPIREIGNCEITEVNPVPFKSGNLLCQWVARNQYLIYHGGLAYDISKITSSCVQERACEVRELNKNDADLECLRHTSECLVECDDSSQVVHTTSYGLVLIAVKADDVWVDCSNLLYRIRAMGRTESIYHAIVQ
jgi:hypothetical protein